MESCLHGQFSVLSDQNGNLVWHVLLSICPCNREVVYWCSGGVRRGRYRVLSSKTLVLVFHWGLQSLTRSKFHDCIFSFAQNENRRFWYTILDWKAAKLPLYSSSWYIGVPLLFYSQRWALKLWHLFTGCGWLYWELFVEVQCQGVFLQGRSLSHVCWCPWSSATGGEVLWHVCSLPGHQRVQAVEGGAPVALLL